MVPRTKVAGIVELVVIPALVLGVIASAWADEPTGRVPWRTSRITGSPDPPPPFVATRWFTSAKFKEPVCLVYSAELERFFVCERGGKLSSLRHRRDAEPEAAFDFSQQLNQATWPADAGKLDALYAIAFHPRFSENRTCFVCYTLAHKTPGKPNLLEGSRISRFRVTATDPPRLDPDSEQILLTWEQGGHNGCDLQFGPDGCLYISTGDARPPSPPDELHTGQDITDLLSSILRIDVDHPDDGRGYGIPKDNPFVGVKVEGKPAREEVWAYGFRNPWRMSFDRQTGELWVGDVGWELWEMVHKVEKGGNYGWSVVEGRQLIHASDTPGPTPIRAPLIELPHTIAASVTGGIVYRGKKFPELYGAYVFGDWEFRRLWAARCAGDRLVELKEITRPSVRIVSFGQDADGELYYLDYDTGLVYTLERNPGQGQNKDFPTRLSETGLFASVSDHSPADGVLPFDINSPQWHDGAYAERWLALPGDSGVTVYPGEGKPMPSQVYWHNFRLHFPKDAVLVKTLSLETEQGQPSSRRRVETQILHFDGADWRAYSYAWRDDQSDADLVPGEGGERSLVVRDASHPSGQREYVWRFHDRTQCLQCHSQWPQYAIGFHLSQLNRSVPGPQGSPVNQLVRLGQTGHLVRKALDDAPQPPYDEKLAATEARLTDPRDPSTALDARARSYLHANCSHCHRFNGGGVVGLDLLSDKPLAATRVLEPPIRGDFGLPEARIVSPGHPQRSTLLYRMAKFGRDRMPHVGSEWPDPTGLRLIADWIESLDPKRSPDRPQSPDVGNLAERLTQPDEALRLARGLALGELSASQRDALLKAAAQLEYGPIRDLFDGYLPSSGDQRRLGPRPRAATIAPLTGDAQRGKALFWATSSKCATCHKVGEQGVNLGPELTRIGQKRSRDELLDSLINPSRTIEPTYAAYQVLTNDGRSTVGLLVRRASDAIVLRDAQNKEIVLPAGEIDRVAVSRVSLMPEGVLAAFTPQEAADLLEYLTSLR